MTRLVEGATEQAVIEFLDTLSWIPRHIHLSDVTEGCYCATCVHFRWSPVDDW